MQLLHYVNLGIVGGVEHQFLQFMDYTRARMGVDHAVIAGDKNIHPHLRADIYRDATSFAMAKSRWGFTLPRWPSAVRTWHHRRIIHKADPDLVLLWNSTGGRSRIVDTIGAGRCVYWDRSASWGTMRSSGDTTFLSRVPCVLANSRASQRMMQLRWRYDGDIAVCRNALRPNMVPVSPQPKPYPHGRAIRIGVAARLEPQKGVCLAVHALYHLCASGFDAELHIAGTGGELASLKRTVDQLGVGEHVVFHGLVRDMIAFYQAMDCLLHLPIWEPLAGVCVEALAYGCPVVTANVDGAPEIVEQGATGSLLQPELSLTDYCELGGSRHELPPYVYDPTNDVVKTPGAVDPKAAAAAVAALFGDADRYVRASTAAVRVAIEKFDYGDHARTVMAALTRFLETGKVSADAPDGSASTVSETAARAAT